MCCHNTALLHYFYTSVTLVRLSVSSLRMVLIVSTIWKWAALSMCQRNMLPYSGYKGEGTLNIDAAPGYQIT